MSEALTGTASPSIEGVFYQADVSSWIALDLVVAKRVADSVTLEPAGYEDLEADLLDEAQASAASTAELGTYRLIVQAKLRNTGPWSLTGLKTLAHHGKARPSAKERLAEPQTRYVLVTSAAVQGDALGVAVTQLGAWPSSSTTLPPSLKLAGAEGRFAVLAGEDEFKIQRRLRELLEDAFRIPHVQLDAAKQALRDGTLARMRTGSDWTRAELEALIRGHGGSIASAPELEGFVPPTNWPDAVALLDQENAIILTGPTGTGKTLTAVALAQHAKTQDPAADVVEVVSPRQITSYQGSGAAIFTIEDPWGKYQIHPDATAWTNELPMILAKASARRRFIITSRTDILQNTQGDRRLQARWSFKLEAHHYDARQRKEIYDRLTRGLPRHLHGAALQGRDIALEALTTPLEIENYFANLAGGPERDEDQPDFLRRCVERAGKDGLEAAAAEQVTTHDALAEAVVLWGLLKARPKLSREWLPRLAGELGKTDATLGDRLEWWVNIQVASRNLRQTGEVLSYFHNRVEKGVQARLLESPARVGRIIAQVADALVSLDEHGAAWGREAAARMLAALKPHDLFVPLSPATQGAIDAWLAAKVTSEKSAELTEYLQIAAAAGSLDRAVTQLAAWLLQRGDGFGGILQWLDPAKPDAWYDAMRAAAETAEICDGFIRHVLPYDQTHYPDDFGQHLLRLCPASLPVFVATARHIVPYGCLWNADVIAQAAVQDTLGFEEVLAAAVAFQRKISADGPDRETWLAMANGELGEDYAEHVASDHDEGASASTLIETYAAARRSTGGWKTLADHPFAADLLWAWINICQDNDEALQPGELQGLAAAAKGHRHEDRFWSSVAQARWDASLDDDLLQRLVQGSPDDDVRRAAAACLAISAANLEAPLVRELLVREDRRRQLELIIDLTEPTRQKHETACGAMATRLASAFAADVRAAAAALTGDAAPSPDAVQLLRQLDPRPNRDFALRRARALLRAGDDMRPAIREELAHEDWDFDLIELAETAIEIAIAQQLWDVVQAALTHRLAGVRRQALEALAARHGDPLPASLLALAADRGSGVRKALVKVLASRPHAGHVETLVRLCADPWEAYGSAYGPESIHAIAQSAADALTVGPDLSADQAARLADLIRETSDPELRGKLIDLLGEHAGAAGRDRLLELTLETSRGYHGLTAQALALSSVEIETKKVDAIPLAHILRRPARIAAFIAMLVGKLASAERLRTVAKQLAGDPDRKVLLIALLLGARLADRPEAADVAKRLPEALAAAAEGAFGDGERLQLDDLRPWASEEVLLGLTAALPFLFPTLKPARRPKLRKVRASAVAKP